MRYLEDNNVSLALSTARAQLDALADPAHAHMQTDEHKFHVHQEPAGSPPGASSTAANATTKAPETAAAAAASSTETAAELGGLCLLTQLRLDCGLVI